MYLKIGLQTAGYLPVQKIQPAYKGQNRTRYRHSTHAKTSDFVKVLNHILHNTTNTDPAASCRRTDISDKTDWSDYETITTGKLRRNDK